MLINLQFTKSFNSQKVNIEIMISNARRVIKGEVQNH